ncbi:MAG: alpha/beta hydrolase family protein [Pseudodesulfovibrio sp.]|uniref:alpha/beta hydrolase family protein n=1 Tax=Pseudodesulfovibrio sp. TaxID=2035812 RepID=UPI003D0CDE51
MSRSFLRPLSLLLLLGLFLGGCGGPYPIDALAPEQGFRAHVLAGETFDLRWFGRGRGATLRVYIEGDGRAWLTRTRPSSDPTPRRAVGFELAAADPSSAVAYLARPCQYAEEGGRRNCVIRFWTSARYAEPVVRDLSLAVDAAKGQAGAERVELVGYSGGGALVVLLAARRDDVTGIVTVAGNLDHAWWTDQHRVSPLADSLNPMDFVRRVQSIPQVHVAGADDEIIPPAMALRFVAGMSDASRARVMVVPGMGHDGDWREPVAEALAELEALR